MGTLLILAVAVAGAAALAQTEWGKSFTEEL